jgi:hypothetical protein
MIIGMGMGISSSLRPSGGAPPGPVYPDVDKLWLSDQGVTTVVETGAVTEWSPVVGTSTAFTGSGGSLPISGASAYYAANSIIFADSARLISSGLYSGVGDWGLALEVTRTETDVDLLVADSFFSIGNTTLNYLQLEALSSPAINARGFFNGGVTASSATGAPIGVPVTMVLNYSSATGNLSIYSDGALKITIALSPPIGEAFRLASNTGVSRFLDQEVSGLAVRAGRVFDAAGLAEINAYFAGRRA